MSIDGVDPVSLLGEHNKKLNLLREAYPEATVTQRGTNIKIKGTKHDTQHLKHHLELMMRLLEDHRDLSTQTIEDILAGENPHLWP
jgi:phosphate starvation-inducible PhoH-like protein